MLQFDTLDDDAWEERVINYDDLFSGTNNKWSSFQYMLPEADNVLFVATTLHEKLQRYAELCMLPNVLLALSTAPDCTGVSTGGDPLGGMALIGTMPARDILPSQKINWQT